MPRSLVEVWTLVAVIVFAGSVIGVPVVDATGENDVGISTSAVSDRDAGTSGGVRVGNESPARPENVSVHVVVRTRGVGSGDVRVRVRYPARNETEAERAENGSLDAAWFNGDERVKAAFEERGEPLAEANRSPESHATSPTVSSSEHGDVVVTRTYLWDGPFAADGDRFEMGPTLATHLENGTVLRVQVPSDWAPDRATTEPEPVGHSGTLKEYRWRVGDESDPAVAFNRSVADGDTDAGGQSLGPAGGAVLAAVAVHLWVAGRRRDA
ncbi:hypothetical protein G9464_14650 [Halostella sp. JP-L12]|uniref:hypothetical protein n=1 Tax=Halostella TaxID=1843185 RepID=UPI000EF78DF7|nr:MULTISPECIES: hypothetical protein [Halostella]NHN48826.1 hypothetical protein [Halostella sp. JP-L12]